MSQAPKEIFFSHASADASAAWELVMMLRRHSLAVWYAPTHIVGSQQWHDEIGLALERCDWFLLLMSPAATESMWVKREIHFVLEERRYDRHITPVLLEPCDVTKLSMGSVVNPACGPHTRPGGRLS